MGIHRYSCLYFRTALGYTERQHKQMKKTLSALLAVILGLSSSAIATSSVTADAYYTDTPTLDGETSRTVTYLYDGVTRTDYVLDSSSKYRRQAFSTVEFDPAQDDLYFDVTGGGTYANALTTTTNTVKTFNRTNADGKVALAAVNGDMWMMSGYHVRVEGKNHSYGGYSDSVVTKAITLPRGFTMYDGEIICTTNMELETPYEGTFQSFGISSDGEALLGNIIVTTTVENTTRGTTASADGINRLPANNALVMYTDKGYASTYCLSDALEIVIDCSYDYTVKDGAIVTGKVTAVSEPGTARQSMKDNRIILTARGTKTSLLSSYKVGDTVKIGVSIADEYGNTAKWRTVTNCVGGHMPIVIDGVSQGLGNSTNYPTSILGIKENGNVVMLTSWGRRGSTYSYGLFIYQLDELCEELGIKTAFLLDGGGSATMVAETDSGYELTGRPCDSGDTERAVINSVILSVGPSKSGASDTCITFDNGADTYMRDMSNTTYSCNGGVLTVTATTFKRPSFTLDLFGSAAGEYKYMAIEAMPTEKDGSSFGVGVYPSAGKTMDIQPSAKLGLTFTADGTWQRQVIDLSSYTAWQGRMNFVRFNLFDHSGVGHTGEGLSVRQIRFFKTKAEADAFLSGTLADDIIPGDANGDGKVSVDDAVLTLKHLAGWSVTLSDGADADCNGTVDLRDAVMILRCIAAAE